VSLGELLRISAAKYTNSPFVTRTETGETLTYADFNRLTNRIAHGLLAQRIKRGDYVGIMLANGIPFLAASYAMKKIGVVEVSLNTTMRGLSLSRMINLTGCRTLITSACWFDARLCHLTQLSATTTARRPSLYATTRQRSFSLRRVQPASPKGAPFPIAALCGRPSL